MLHVLTITGILVFCFFYSISFVRNSHFESMEEDVLYHLALSNKSHDLKEMFGDVKVRIIPHIRLTICFSVCRSWDGSLL